MANLFENLQTFAKLDFTTFDMSNNVETDGYFGGLDPIYQEPVLAGDTWKIAHNILCKLPPLVAPAFTRIKGIVNTYYCSYASVWKYWNNFISDRPDDSFLNRANQSHYSGQYKEPSIPMYLISFICKIAYGYYLQCLIDGTYYIFVTNKKIFNNYQTISRGLRAYPLSLLSIDSSIPSLDLTDFVKNGLSGTDFPVLSTTQEVAGKGTLNSYITSFLQEHWSSFTGLTYEDVEIDNYHLTDFSGLGNEELLSSWFVYDFEAIRNPTPTYVVDNGFFNRNSFLVYCCKNSVRLLQSFGVPTELIASTPTGYYKDQYLNALPYMCYSSVWQNYYRDNMLQGSELDFSEVNGRACQNYVFDYTSKDKLDSTDDYGNYYGWAIRLDTLPFNRVVKSAPGYPDGVRSNPRYPLYFYIRNHYELFSFLTGYNLRSLVQSLFAVQAQSVENSIILPEYYNGLLHFKYRNVGSDYFTSACVDPMAGRQSIAVPNTIDELRTASKLEEFLERSAWSRDFYNYMKSHFGTKPESAKYNKPLLLGTQVVPINIGEQLQTSESSSTSALGERAGIAEGYGHSGTCDHYFNEHGHVFSLLSFTIDMQYFQGVNRHMLEHKSYLDYPFPEFANLGNESILNKEIYFGTFSSRNIHPLSSNLSVDSFTYNGYNDYTENTIINGTSERSEYMLDGVFGYTPRYSNWKHKRDELHGQFRDTLLFWNTFRAFTQQPQLSHNFISYENLEFISNIDRIFAVVSDDVERFYINIYNNASVRRSLPYVSNPTLN